ncbi:MAG: hypothetical protein E7562_01465 [Ruminococcaceae bacterium]|nr:hypothetical protein [Oscillospiraceae bacterium]
MEDIFLKLLNMSITAGYLVLAIVIIRVIFKRIPKFINCILWALVGIRLVLPYSIESILSLIPNNEPIPADIALASQPQIETGISILNSTVNPIISNSFAPDMRYSANPLQIVNFIAANVWLMVLAVMLLYAVISYIVVRIRVRVRINLKENIYICDNIDTPFILGLIKPCIYIPSNIDKDCIESVILHEKAHIKRLDYIWKPLGFLLLSVYWFNPLIWLAYILLCRDIEFACDERVIKQMSDSCIKSYSRALLSCSSKKSSIKACPLSFGEVGVKQRIKSVLNYKKPTFWISITAVILSIAVAVTFLTNPIKKNKDTSLGEISNIEILSSGSDIDGITINIISAHFDTTPQKSFLEVILLNNTRTEHNFGEEFYIYQKTGNEWKNCRKSKEYSWNSIANILSAESDYTKKYYLDDIQLESENIYRFEAIFLSSDPLTNSKPKAWVEFKLSSDNTTGETILKANKLVYDHGMFSYVQTADSAPVYCNKNGSLLQRTNGGDVWFSLGKLEEVKLNDDNFNSRFINDYFQDISLEKLVKNNKKMWQLKRKNEDISELYIVTLQNNGQYYLGYGYYDSDGNYKYNNPDNSYIRWLYECKVLQGLPPEQIDSPSIIKTSYCGSEQLSLYSGALNTKMMIYSSVRHLPIYKFESVSQLNKFKERMGAAANSQSLSNIPSFNDITSNCNDDFFENYVLFAIYIHSDDNLVGFTVDNIYNDGENFVVHVASKPLETKETPTGSFILTVSVPKSVVESCKEFDADVDNIPRFNNILVYGYYDSKDVLMPRFVLDTSDMTFNFTYSGLSSYWPRGKYTLTDTELLLKTTDDFAYEYVFKRTENGFVFDEKASSAIPKYNYSAENTEKISPVPDGALFTIIETE